MSNTREQQAFQAQLDVAHLRRAIREVRNIRAADREAQISKERQLEALEQQYYKAKKDEQEFREAITQDNARIQQNIARIVQQIQSSDRPLTSNDEKFIRAFAAVIDTKVALDNALSTQSQLADSWAEHRTNLVDQVETAFSGPVSYQVPNSDVSLNFQLTAEETDQITENLARRENPTDVFLKMEHMKEPFTSEVERRTEVISANPANNGLSRDEIEQQAKVEVMQEMGVPQRAELLNKMNVVPVVANNIKREHPEQYQAVRERKLNFFKVLEQMYDSFVVEDRNAAGENYTERMAIDRFINLLTIESLLVDFDNKLKEAQKLAEQSTNSDNPEVQQIQFRCKNANNPYPITLTLSTKQRTQEEEEEEERYGRKAGRGSI